MIISNSSRIIRLLFPKLFEPSKPRVQVPEKPSLKPFKTSLKTLKNYIGHYYNKQLNITYTLSLTDKNLTLKLPYAKEGFILQSLEKDVFKHDSGLELRFQGNKLGQITGFAIPGYRTRNIKFKKLAAK